MPDIPPAETAPPEIGRLADNIAYFGRLLRDAGLPVGPASVLDAIRAVETAGLGGKQDFYWTLHSVFVTRHEQSLLFRQAFELFWRQRALTEKLIAMMSPQAVAMKEPPKPKAGAQRVNDAFYKEPPREVEEKKLVEFDARLTMSEREILKERDFAQMTAEEIAAAKKEMAGLRLPFDIQPTRRLRPGGSEVIDLRRTLRAAMRSGGDLVSIAYRQAGEKHPPLVALCDISGSMADYSRLFLHFLHAISEKGRRVHAFVFATRLTNITRSLRTRDPDEALEHASRAVKDWDGGTRIAHCLERFNKDWSRRVLGQGATVLLITDGLERQVDPGLAKELDRLHRSCRRLIWLNPLLRFDAFEARAAGIKAMLPHVDEFRTIHNLKSMGDLVKALDRRADAAADPGSWLKRVG
ncbi:VWA domain-containing protein [Labrys portucalensis]|uniref:VWA domain-containing protein n=1 Tax=Labrys neptuniae TaxID=376174 RepID=A0ABV6ZB74_9HYPH